MKLDQIFLHGQSWPKDQLMTTANLSDAGYEEG